MVEPWAKLKVLSTVELKVVQMEGEMAGKKEILKVVSLAATMEND